MKIPCNIQISVRPPGTDAMIRPPTRTKTQKGCLTIVKNSVKNKDIFLLLQTAQNKLGTQYKVEDNIERVYTKFVTEGKATIRIKQPPHDLILQGEPIQLKTFLHVLQMACSRNAKIDVLPISNMKPKTLTTTKTKVVVKKKSDYPVLAGFPRTTQSLCLARLERKSFDRQILRLQSLRILDLSENQISSLPREVGFMPNLQELYLSHNRFGNAERSTSWSWMHGEHIRRNLRHLDLTGNNLTRLPDALKNLRSLVTLRLGDNKLANLPQGIGCLRNLKYLELQNNSLEVLPGSMMHLRLESLDVSGNRFVTRDNWHSLQEDTSNSSNFTIAGPLSLIEIAGRVSVNSRLHYDKSTIPFTLVKYLDDARYCVCGKACFQENIRARMEVTLSRFARSVKLSGESMSLLDSFFCTTKCANQFRKTLF